MLEKIDRFIDKYLNWKVLKNLVLSELFLFPYMFVIGLYKVSMLHRLIIITSICISMYFIRKATQCIKKQESL